jgi:hypothetical protein
MSRPNSINDFVFLCMRDGKWWTFWELQNVIKEKTDRFYGEPSLSAAIRDLRKPPFRAKYGIDPNMPEVVKKRRIQNRKGYEYKLIGLNYE